MTEARNFQVHLRGIIELLSGHLYSGPEVYIRELLQNAADAITARRQADADLVGNIRFEVMTSSAKGPATLVVTDNGVGLTESEVHEFLATIGQSSKRGDVNRDEFIGQFGIGLLSGFMVSEEIVLITQSALPGNPAVEWTGRSDGTYSVRTLERDFEPGSQVYLRAKPGCGEFFESKFVKHAARRFGMYLPEQIEVSSDDHQENVNVSPAWQRVSESRETQRELLLQTGRELFETDFLDAIILETEAGGISGIAYVLPHAASLSARRTHRVYLKGMLLSEQAENLLPDWAFFVRCVLNVTDLRPTASRESFHDDEYVAEARAALGERLRSWLVDLAQSDRDRLDQIIALHYMPMKALAVDDDDFCRMLIDWLPFETTLGTQTLVEVLRHSDTIRFVATRDEFRQVGGVAAAQGVCLVNAGYVYDLELLEKVPILFPDRQVEQFQVDDLVHEFGDLTLDERDQVMEFLRLADLTLQPFHCRADMRRFDPQSLPTLYTTNDQATFLRSVEQAQEVSDELWSGVLNGLTDASAASSWASLCFNFQNPLIQRVSGISDAALIRRTVEMLYVQALLLGHYPLKSAEMQLLTGGLLNLIDLCLGDDGSSTE